VLAEGRQVSSFSVSPLQIDPDIFSGTQGCSEKKVALIDIEKKKGGAKRT
jgi:hypothetical protein